MKTQLTTIGETALVERAKQGDTHAFEQLMERHSKMLFGMAFRMVRDQDRANELTNIAWTRAWRRIKTFRGDSQFNTWIVRILHNLCLDGLRKIRQLREIPAEDATEARIPDVFELKHELFCEPEVFRLADSHELQSKVQDVLRHMPKIKREILVLHYLQERTYGDIAQIMNCVPGTVMSRLFYARKDFAKLWQSLHEAAA